MTITARFDDLSSFWRFFFSFFLFWRFLVIKNVHHNLYYLLTFWRFWAPKMIRRFMLLFWRFLQIKNLQDNLYINIFFSSLKAIMFCNCCYYQFMLAITWSKELYFLVICEHLWWFFYIVWRFWRFIVILSI